MSQRAGRWVGVVGWLGVVGVSWLVSGGSAQAQTTVSVLGLSSEDGDDAIAGALTSAVRSQAETYDDYEVSGSQVSLAQMTMAQDCEISDAQCRIAVASALKSERVLYGSLLRESRRTFELELHMANGRDGTETRASRTFSTRDTSDATFARLARELLAELRGESSPEAAPATEPARATAAGDDTPQEATTGAEATIPADDAPSSNDWLGYTLVGLAVASSAMTVFSWIEIDKAEQDPAFDKYRKAVPTSVADDACDEAERGVRYGLSTTIVDDARAACRQGRTFEVLQYVFLGTALASAGVGAYFLLDDESPGEEARAGRSTFALVPRVSTRSAGMNLRLRF